MVALRKWHETHAKITTSEIAAHCGVTIRTVDRWKKSETRPRADEQRKLTAFTNGEVTANDFIAAPEPSDTDHEAALAGSPS